MRRPPSTVDWRVNRIALWRADIGSGEVVQLIVVFIRVWNFLGVEHEKSSQRHTTILHYSTTSVIFGDLKHVSDTPEEMTRLETQF